MRTCQDIWDVVHRRRRELEYGGKRETVDRISFFFAVALLRPGASLRQVINTGSYLASTTTALDRARSLNGIRP